MAKYINKNLNIGDTNVTLEDLVLKKANSKKMIWGTSISLELEIGQMGIAILSQTAIFQFWRNSENIDYRLASGNTDIDVFISEDKSTITFSSQHEFAMTIFYI